jgi:hypothetical protein
VTDAPATSTARALANAATELRVDLVRSEAGETAAGVAAGTTAAMGAQAAAEPGPAAIDFSRAVFAERVDSTLRFLAAGANFVRNAPSGATRADKAACEQLILLRGLLRRGVDLPASRRQWSATAVTRHGFETPRAPGRGELLAQLLRVSESRLRGRAIEDALFWHPERAPLLGMGTALLDQLGSRSDAWRAMVERAWREEFVGVAERTPHQELELRWSRSLLVGSAASDGEDLLAWDDTARRSVMRLGWVPLMTADDAYAWTHSIFYLTDFGDRPLPLDERERATLREALDAAIVWSLARYDFDLLGEFLLSAIYSGAAGSGRWWVGLSVLVATWDRLGWVPDRELDIDGVSIDEARERLFFAVYHANLVAALLAHEVATLALDPPASSSAAAADGRRATGGVVGAVGKALFGEEVARRVAASVPIADRLAFEGEVLLVATFLRRDLDGVTDALDRLRAAEVDSAIVRGAALWLETARTPGAGGARV